MIRDAFLLFDSAANLAQVTGTYTSANILDLHMSGIPTLANLQGARDLGIGDNPALKLLVQVVTAFTGTTGTLQVILQGAPDNGSGVPGSYSNWWASPLYTVAQLNAGSRLMDMDLPRPPDGVSMPRFLRMSYVIATATMTAGTVSAEIILDRQDQPYQGTDNSISGGYPAGLTIAN